ncbi:MAG: histidine kinase [Chitinophagaceae bacterium]
MQITRYSNKEPIVFLWFMVPYVFFMNWLIFGQCVFSSLKIFFASFFSSLLYFAIIYFFFGVVAVLVKKRFPGDNEFFIRIGAMLPVFYLMNLIMIQGVYLVYENVPVVSCSPIRSNEWWITGYACICSTIITFVNEAMVGWDKWKASVTEMGRLHHTYQKSRLLVLKRQINPHFLFNCFNSLSSLINEEGDEAEKFLDEMTKVYRYLLKGDNEALVPLSEELRFIQSYLFLTQTRFGSALQTKIDVEQKDIEKSLPPLSLQVVLENIIYRNAFSKSSPLFVRIYSSGNNRLIIENNQQQKQVKEATDYEEGLDNLVNKYQLLNQRKVEIDESDGERRVMLPLISSWEVMT